MSNIVTFTVNINGNAIPVAVDLNDTVRTLD